MQSREYARLGKIAASGRRWGSLLVLDISALILITSTMQWYIYNTSFGLIIFFLAVGEYFIGFALLISVIAYVHTSHKVGLIGLEDTGSNFRIPAPPRIRF